MTPTIRVDDEVYAALQADAEAFIDTPNTVLRRILGLEGGSGTTASPARSTAPNRLTKMLSDGVLLENEELLWERKRQAEVHRAQVAADGRLLLEDGSIHQTPSGAAGYLAGYDVNGWKAWKRARDDRTLDDLWSNGPASATTDLPRRAKREMDMTTQKEFRPVIVAVLRAAGGREQVEKVLEQVEAQMESKFLPGDYSTVTNNEPRWRNAARWERNAMVAAGLIKKSEQRGIWELTPEAI